MEAISRNFSSNDWITLIFIIAFMLIALMKLYKPQLLFGYAVSFFSQGFIENRVDKKPSVFSTFHVLVFLLTVLMLSLALYFTVNTSFKNSINLYLFILIGLSSYMVIKYVLLALIAKTVNIEDKTRYFIFSKSGYLYTISIWLFPILVMFQYGYANVQILLFFIFVLFLFRALLIIKNNKNLIFNNFFYFILYFCTLELAPLLIIYKTTTS